MNSNKTKLIEHLKRRKLYYLYAVAFLILYFLTIWIYEIVYNKTLLWIVDGIETEYIPFVYIGQWGRRLIHNIIHFDWPVIPMWDMSIGYGSDIITTFQGALYDPFNWISIIFPARFSEEAFRLLILLKRFFAGITFIWLAKYKKADDVSTLAGAISYVFSVSMLICIKQVYLIDPFYVMPLIILGVEKLWENKKHLPFYSAVLAFGIINSYYYTFMIGIFVAFLLVYKIIVQKGKTWKWFWALAVRFFFGTLLGAVTGVGLLLGGIIQLLGTSRMSYTRTISLLYDEWIHNGMFMNLVGGVIDTGTDVLVGISIVVFVCLVLLFFEKGHIWEKAGLVGLTVCLFIPYVGHIFNGFNYATDRWIFGYALLVSWIVCVTFKRLCSISVKECIAVIAVFALHYLICMKAIGGVPSHYVPAVMLGVASVVILLAISIYMKRYKNKKAADTVGDKAADTVGDKVAETVDDKVVDMVDEKVVEAVDDKAYDRATESKATFKSMFGKLNISYIAGFALLGISVIFSAYIYLSPKYGGFIDGTFEQRRIYEHVIYSDGKTAVINDDICENARYEEFRVGRVRNSSMLIGAKGFDFYMHFYNNDIDKYHKDLGVVQDPDCFCYYDLYTRTILEFLNGVNAIVSPLEEAYVRPGYDNFYKEHVIYDQYRYAVYTGDYPRTLAFSYDKAVPYSVYDDMSACERESLMGYACVVDEDHANVAPENVMMLSVTNDPKGAKADAGASGDSEGAKAEADASGDSEGAKADAGASGDGLTEDFSVIIPDNKVPSEIVCAEGTSYVDGIISTNNDHEDIRFNFDTIKEPGHLFLSVEKINWLTLGSATTMGMSAAAGKDGDYLDNRYCNWQRSYTQNSHLYGGKEDLVLDLGYIRPESEVNCINLHFDNIGDYSVKDIQVYFRPDTEVLDVSDKLSDKYLNMTQGNNRINVDISGVEDRYVYLAVPYSEGWKAKIDGTPVKILKANTAFMAIDLGPEGDVIGDEGDVHILEMSFSSPYYGIGILITLAGIAIMIVFYIITRKQEEKE